MAEVSEEAYYRLAQYWGRAQIMRALFNGLIDEHNGEIEAVIQEGYGLRLETYLSYWLAAVFVTLEGFNKLKLKDKHVQKLFNAHVGDLKELRHVTYHFTTSQDKGGKAVAAINWVEELHVALGMFLIRHVDMSGIDK